MKNFTKYTFLKKFLLVFVVLEISCMSNTKTANSLIYNFRHYWLEEPFTENIEDGRKLKQWMRANGFENTFYADGVIRVSDAPGFGVKLLKKV